MIIGPDPASAEWAVPSDFSLFEYHSKYLGTATLTLSFQAFKPGNVQVCKDPVSPFYHLLPANSPFCICPIISPRNVRAIFENQHNIHSSAFNSPKSPRLFSKSYSSQHQDPITLISCLVPAVTPHGSPHSTYIPSSFLWRISLLKFSVVSLCSHSVDLPSALSWLGIYASLHVCACPADLGLFPGILYISIHFLEHCQEWSLRA